MEMVDSKEKLLNAANIITIAAKDLGTGGIPLPSALASVAKEGTLSSADTVQVGNTVFLAHRGKGKNKNKMFGRAFNADTARNYINNLVKYFNHLKNKGITHYSAQFNGEKMRNLLNIVGQNIQDIATKFMIARTKQEGTYRVMIAFGSKQ
tara:strand:- start:14585 stop:15037 length:453 start_codon:yes stop_codon:yes gene_type:complete